MDKYDFSVSSGFLGSYVSQPKIELSQGAKNKLNDIQAKVDTLTKKLEGQEIELIDLLRKRVVSAVFVNDNVEMLTDNHEIIIITSTDEGEGGNDSHCYIESVDFIEALVGKINAVNELKYLKGSEGMDFFGIAIKTENGSCTIDFRHESNGHYGGGYCITRKINYNFQEIQEMRERLVSLREEWNRRYNNLYFSSEIT